MSANFGSNNSQDVELNIASIIDAFMVLIAFLLVTASFLSIGILDAGIASGGKTAAQKTPPPIQIRILLKRDHSIVLETKGKQSLSRTLRSKAGAMDWNREALQEELKELKKKWPTVQAVTLSAENEVEYKSVVVTLNQIRSVMPMVLLGGF